MDKTHNNPGFELEDVNEYPKENGYFENVDLSNEHYPQKNSDIPPIPSTMPTYGPKETRRMSKNIHVASIGFLLLFTAYNGMSNLMSSFYPDGGLGTYTNGK